MSYKTGMYGLMDGWMGGYVYLKPGFDRQLIQACSSIHLFLSVQNLFTDCGCLSCLLYVWINRATYHVCRHRSKIHSSEEIECEYDHQLSIQIDRYIGRQIDRTLSYPQIDRWVDRQIDKQESLFQQQSILKESWLQMDIDREAAIAGSEKIILLLVQANSQQAGKQETHTQTFFVCRSIYTSINWNRQLYGCIHITYKYISPR